MTDDDLRRLAEAATQGPWEACGWLVSSADGGIIAMCDERKTDEEDDANAAFIAAANPTAVLAMMARLRAAEAREARLRWALQDIEQIGGANKLYMPSAIARDALKEPTP